MVEDTSMEFTDVIIRLKEGFEDKDTSKIQSQFVNDARLNFDGRFATVADMAQTLSGFFEIVNQTYLDVVGVEAIHEDPDRPSVTYMLDAAWVDQKDWIEHSHQVRCQFNLIHDPKRKCHLIDGLTVVTVPRDISDVPGDVDFPDPPGATQPKDDGDVFSIWY